MSAAAENVASTVTPADELIGTYSAAWAAGSREDILANLARCWTAQSSYTDPITPTTVGTEALVDVIQEFQAKFPGAQLRPASALDVHGAYGRFAWVLLLPQPMTVDGVTYGRELPGFDFVEFTADRSHISRIVGFFGPLASAADHH